jgi:predicted PurR-regulated permease PerM
MAAAGWFAAAIVAALLWAAPEALFLIFGGLLLGVMLDTLAQFVRRVLPVPHNVALALVCCTLLGVAGWGLAAGGIGLLREVDDFVRTLVKQTQALEEQLSRAGLDPAALAQAGGKPADGEDQSDTLIGMLLPDPTILYRHASSAFGALFGVIGNTILLAFMGIFLAVDLKGYRRMVVHLAEPRRRPRAMRAVKVGLETLRWWLIGQFATMAIIAASVWLALWLLGVPGAVLLGVQAGLVNFIPYLGPLLALVPILLSAFPMGTGVMLWSAAAFLVIQTLEGHVLSPIVQRRAVDLPPVVTLAGLVAFGALFGAAGVAVATPLMAFGYAVATGLRRRNNVPKRRTPEPGDDPGS